MAWLWLLVLLALAGAVGGTWDTCRGTCGLRPMAADHNSLLPHTDPVASDDGTSHVVGGTGVQLGAWPGIVSIQATWENGTWHMCSGVLLSSQWVLTVAHCFIRARDFYRWHVVIGATDLVEPGPQAKVRHIQRVLLHQHYEAATASNDIALLELSQPVECSDYIQLACVPDTSVRVWDLKSCYIAGWSFSGDTDLVLRESKVHLMDTKLCNSSRWYAGAVRAENLCVGYPRGGIDTCKGDSGAPLVCKDNTADHFWLVGMSSWGRGCDKGRHPGIYTSTQDFYDWILLQTGLSPVETSTPVPKPGCTLTPKESPMPEPPITSIPKEAKEEEKKEEEEEKEVVPESSVISVTEEEEEELVPELVPEPKPEPTIISTPEEEEKEEEKEKETMPVTEAKPTPEAKPDDLSVPEEEEQDEEEEEPVPTPQPDRFLILLIPYRSLVKFCKLLTDLVQLLRAKIDRAEG